MRPLGLTGCGLHFSPDPVKISSLLSLNFGDENKL
jgi:hypothetical protein